MSRRKNSPAATATVAMLAAGTAIIGLPPVAGAQNDSPQRIAIDTAGQLTESMGQTIESLSQTALPQTMPQPYTPYAAPVVRDFSDSAPSGVDMRSTRPAPATGGPSVREQPIQTSVGNPSAQRDRLPTPPRDDKDQDRNADQIQRDDLSPEAREALERAEREAGADPDVLAAAEDDAKRQKVDQEKAPAQPAENDRSDAEQGTGDSRTDQPENQGQDQSEGTDQGENTTDPAEPANDGAEGEQTTPPQDGQGEQTQPPAEDTVPAPEPAPVPQPDPCSPDTWPLTPGFDLPQQVADLVDALWLVNGGGEFAPSFYVAPLDKQIEVANRVFQQMSATGQWPQCAPAQGS